MSNFLLLIQVMGAAALLFKVNDIADYCCRVVDMIVIKENAHSETTKTETAKTETAKDAPRS